MFQSQGRFFGGCCRLIVGDQWILGGVSIAGAILWGVLPTYKCSLGGRDEVSIAGAILWGVLPIALADTPVGVLGFNRRGDSLGGAASGSRRCCPCCRCVSIAGAMLWGVLRL